MAYTKELIICQSKFFLVHIYYTRLESNMYILLYTGLGNTCNGSFFFSYTRAQYTVYWTYLSYLD